MQKWALSSAKIMGYHAENVHPSFYPCANSLKKFGQQKNVNSSQLSTWRERKVYKQPYARTRFWHSRGKAQNKRINNKREKSMASTSRRHYVRAYNRSCNAFSANFVLPLFACVFLRIFYFPFRRYSCCFVFFFWVLCRDHVLHINVWSARLHTTHTHTHANCFCIWIP